MPPIVGKVQGIAGVVAALLLPAYVSAFVTPGAGRWTALAGDNGGPRISRCNASPDAATPSAPVAATAEDAKDKLKDVLAANRGSTLEPDVVAAAEVSKYQAFLRTAGLCASWFLFVNRLERRLVTHAASLLLPVPTLTFF